MNDRALIDCLNALVERVDRRVALAPGAYEQDRGYVRRAAEQVLVLRDRLALGTFLGPIGPERTKPQFLLQFEQECGRRIVLKVYGKSRPAEALVQAAWLRHGVRVVDVLDAGDEGVSWLVLRAVSTSPVVSDGELSAARLPALCAELAAVLAPAHAVGARLVAEGEVPESALQRLDAAVGHHLDVALAALARHGYGAGRDWHAYGATLLDPDNTTLLHGDLVIGNVVRDAADGGLLLLDSCGYLGPAEFDAARWSARMGGAAGAGTALAVWLDAEPSLDSDLAHRLLALELVMEAGVRELVKEEQGRPWNVRDPATEELLAAAEATRSGLSER